MLDVKDGDHLDQQPPLGAQILAPKPSVAQGETACAQPFHEPMVTQAVQPDWPDAMRYLTNMQPVVAIRVALTADGKLADAWVWGPSGYPEIDDAVLKAAQQSKYSGAVAYCVAVPGEYLFKVRFAPR